MIRCCGYTHGYSGDYNELLYLRARFYSPAIGRFETRDAWRGDYNDPLSLNRWIYVSDDPINSSDPSGMCANCRLGEHVKVDARPYPKQQLAIKAGPNSSEILGYVPDYGVVQVYSENTVGSGKDAYRKILRFDQDTGKYLIGYVKNIQLLDNCTGGDPFACLPVPYTAWYQTYGFGPNGYAELVCAHGKSDCPYTKLRGLHNGLDFSVPAGTPLIWAGSQEATYVSWPGDADPQIAFKYKGYLVIYGHRLANYLNEERTSVYSVRPGQTIGESGDPGNPSHLHLGVRKYGKNIFINPQYLFGPLLRATISTHNMGSYPLGLSSMSMYSFDTTPNGTQGPWFWNDPCNWIGIVWGTMEQ